MDACVLVFDSYYISAEFIKGIKRLHSRKLKVFVPLNRRLRADLYRYSMTNAFAGRVTTPGYGKGLHALFCYRFIIMIVTTEWVEYTL